MSDVPEEDVISVADALRDIAHWQEMSAMALLHMSGAAVLEDHEGKLRLRARTPEDDPVPVPRSKINPGITETRRVGEEVIAWVFTFPAPHNDVEIVCYPDQGAVAGRQCFATQKLVGGERQKYEVTFVPAAWGS